jgi:hypothetical protein
MRRSKGVAERIANYGARPEADVEGTPVVNTDRNPWQKLMLLLGYGDELQRESPQGSMPMSAGKEAYYEWAKGQRNADILARNR